MPFPAPTGDGPVPISIFAATDPVGGLDQAIPIHPDQGSSKPFEYWDEQIHKRNPRKRKPQTPAEKPHDPSHQIDDFA